MKGISSGKSATSRYGVSRIDSLLWADTMLETTGAKDGDAGSGVSRSLHGRPLTGAGGSVASRSRRC